MSINLKYIDHLFVVMGPAYSDSRSLNLAKTIQKRGETAVVLGWGEKTLTAQYLEGVWIQTFKKPNSGRMMIEWFRFYNVLREYTKGIKAKYYWAMDLYTLPVLYHLKPSASSLLYDAREIYSGLGVNEKKPVKQAVVSEVERIYVHKADTVFTSGQLDSNILEKLYHFSNTPYILNVPQSWPAESSDRLRRYFDIPESQKIMLYQGAVLPGRGLEPFLKVMKDAPQWNLCILGGDGIYLQNINTLIREYGLKNRVHKRNLVPYDELPAWTSSADAGLCFIEPLTLSLKMALPNKLFEYAQGRIPIIASDLPQIKPIMEKFDAGELLSTNAGTEEWVAAIDKLENPANKEKYQHALEQMAAEYCWENQEDKIYRLYSGDTNC